MPLSTADLGNPIALAVLVGFPLGKSVGVVTCGSHAVRPGLARRSSGMRWGLLVGGGRLAGVGFTMALFAGYLTFLDESMVAANLGILSASVVPAAAGLAAPTGSPPKRRVAEP